jgi:hypothetical protein
MNQRQSPVAAGFGAISHAKLVLLLALTSVALGAAAALPLTPTLWDVMTRTLAGDHFIRNHPTLAPTDFFDVLREKAPALDGTRRAASGLAILGVFLQMFYAGGIVAVVGRGPFSFGQFLEPARRNLWHNLKCFFLFATLAGALLGSWLGGGFALRKKLLEDLAPDAAVNSLSFWGLLAVGLVFFAALSLLYDFARAVRRFSPQAGAWRAYGFAWRALSGSWLRAIGLWLFWLLVGGAAVLALFAVTWDMQAVSRPAIALLMLLQFGVLWLRSALRVAAWGSYAAFLEPRSRQALCAITRVTIAPSAPAPAASRA